MATINLTSNTASGYLETDFDQVKLLINGEDTGDLAANTAFRTTPSTIITAGTNLTWAGNTLNATGGGVTDLQEAFDGGQTITIADTDNQTLAITNNDNTNDPTTMSITNNTTAGNGLYVTTGTQPYVEATGLAYLRSGNASDTARVLNIVNSGTGHGVDVAQYGAAEGLRINKYAGSGQSGGVLRLVQDDAAADREVIYSRNDGTSYNTWIANNGTGTALFIDQNGDGVSLEIDSEATTQQAVEVRGVTTNADTVLLYNNGVQTSGNVLHVVQENASSTTNATEIKNDGTGDGLFIDQNGDGVALNIDSEATSAASYGLQLVTGQGASLALFEYDANNRILFKQPGGTNGTAHFYRNYDSVTTTAPVMYVQQDNASDDQQALSIKQDGTGRALNVDMDGDGFGIFVQSAATTTANAAINVRSDGGCRTLTLDQNGDVQALYIDSESSSNGAIFITQDAGNASVDLAHIDSPDGTNKFTRDVTSAVSAGPVAAIIQDNTGDDQNALLVQQDGTGRSISSVQNGNTGTSYAHYFEHAGTGRNGLFYNSNASSAEIALEVQNEGTGTGLYVDQNGNGVALNIDNAGTNSSLVVDSTEVIDSAGKVQLAAMDATGTPSSTTYLRGDGTWSTPAGGGGTSVPYEQSFTATASQTNFTLTNTPAVAWVWLNGASQDASTWSISGDDIVLSTAATSGDSVEVYYLTGAGIATANPYAHFTISTNQNIGGANGTVTYIDWDGTEIHKDTGFTHSTVTNPSRIQVDADGRYQIKATVWGDSTGAGRTMLDVALRIDGTTAHILGAAQNYCRGAAYNDQFGVTMITEVDLTNGQYIEVSSTVNWTDATYTINTVENRMEFIIRKVA